MMKLLCLSLSVLICMSCDTDAYESHAKSAVFTIKKLKTRGKRSSRGFYVQGSDDKIRYRDIRSGKYAVGDTLRLQYDSVVNLSKGTYEIVLQRRLSDDQAE